MAVVVSRNEFSDRLLGLLFDALMRTLDPEETTFLARLDEHLEQEYRKLEDTPGDHEKAMRFLLGVCPRNNVLNDMRH